MSKFMSDFQSLVRSLPGGQDALRDPLWAGTPPLLTPILRNHWTKVNEQETKNKNESAWEV